MSTKTTFKRIALVAVAALGLSVVAVAPSTAVVNSDTLTVASTTSAVTIGNPTTVGVTAAFLAGQGGDSVTNTVVLSSAPAGNSALPTFVLDTTNSGTAGTDGQTVINNVAATRVNSNSATPVAAGQSYTIAARNAGATSSAATVTLTPLVAGTYVVTITQTGGVATRTATWTVTASARTAVTGAASLSVMTAAAAPFGYGVEATGISAPRTVAAPQEAAQVAITLRNSATANTAVLADVTALTASISGPGTLSWTPGTNYGRAVTAGSASLTPTLYVYADGNAGVSTITIAMGTTVISTETITFFGAPASIVSTVVNPIVAATGGSATGAISAVVKDALGNPVAGANLFATSDALTIVNNSYTAANAATDAAGKTSFTLAPGALGTANITVGTGSSAAAVAPVNAAPVAVRSGSTTVAGIKFSLDATDYTPGQAAVLTISFTDAAGLPVANSTQSNALMTSNIASSIALTGAPLPAVAVTTATPFPAALTISNNAGTIALPINMPITSGEVTISAGTLIGTVAGTASVKANVSNAEIAAAQDAAAEATDAANAATDAANAAAEAADAATAAAQDAADAVAALSTEVAAMITALKKQITALTNLVIKIQKKVRA